jgi:hypothetical protein
MSYFYIICIDFISHTKSDKPLGEPIAQRLTYIFGKENVFYDLWSIQRRWNWFLIYHV